MSMEGLLEEAGCKLDTATVVFDVEPVLFRRKLGNKLRSQSSLADQFVEELQTYTEDPAIFRKFLLPSTLAESVPKTSRTSNSESLFKTLLAIDAVQPSLITYLLERLPEFYDELENDNSSSCTARLILHQLRWLDYIAQPEELTGKLIEIIQITPSIIQYEIITSLPDIINDSEHKPIVVYLKELMNENSELTVPILDALSNLTLHSESLEDVRDTVLDRLESAELDDLATIVKFLLQTATTNTIDLVILGIRQKLDFRSLGRIQQQQQKKQKYAAEALILESIKLGLQFHKFVCDAWLRSIVALEEQREHKVIDFLVLIILYSMTPLKKRVETIIRKKIIQGSIAASLIQETIMQHAEGLAGYWSVLLSLSESLLRSCQQNNVISPCASTLYITCFKSTDVYYRQEIVGALVTHIGSGVEAEMNVALNVLLQLVKTNVSQVAVYSVFVKGILDYLDNLNVYQIRTLFDIFSLLALTTGNASDSSASLWSDIQIVIRKQLSNPREKYKNIGIIASLSSVKVLGSQQLCQDYQSRGGGSSTQSEGKSSYMNAMRHPLLRQATNLLELALRYSKEYPNCIAFIYDELAHMFAEESMDERFISWVKENMASDFTEFYVVAHSDALEFIEQAKLSQYSRLMPELQMGLDGENDQIAVKFYELIHNPELKKKKSVMAPMCSILNLIQSCEQQLNQGSLVEVDALFGCSVILFKIDDIEDLSTEEVEYACDMLFYTINWFRELLNAFMFTKEEENYRTRLISRLRNVLEMEQLLSQLMQQLANYVPLEFQQTSSAAFEDSSQITRNEESQETSAKPAKKTAKTSIMKISSVNELRPYMRAFHIHLLEILKYNEELEEDRMTFEEINYVLEDIKQKLDIKVVPPPVTAFGKKKSTEDNIKYPSCNSIMLARMDAQKLMQKVVAYLPDILQTLENLYSEIQTKDIEPGRIEGSEDLVLAVSHILNILNKLISWPDIQNSDNQEILQNIIRSIADRISGDSKQKKNSTTQDEDLQQAFRYLSQFGNSIPQSTTAVLLFKILQRLMTFSGQASANLKRDALGVVKQIISTGWFDWRDIRKDIQFLFEQYIELSKNPLEVLHDIVNRVLPAFEEEQSLKEYPLLREDTLINHYQAVINQTVKAFDMLKDTDQEAEVVLLQTSQIVKAFERITNYVKTKENKSLLGILLKTSRTYIEQFTKHSIPYFTGIFKAHSNSVLAIFKDFQTTTRMLQIICSHVKVQKEVQLSSYVPPLKKALEIVIYQVKMLLTENRIPSSAFFMGALKHRDMRGAEISSQIPREPSDNEEEQEQEEVEEEEEGEEMNTNSEETTRQNSPATTNSSNKATSARRVYKPEPKNRASPGNSALAQSYRTSSVVPSSSEEEDEGQEDEEEQEDDDDDDDDDLPRQSSNSKKRKAQEDLDEIVIDFNNKSSDDHDDEDSPPPNLSRNTKHQQSQNLAKRKRLGVGRYSASLKHL